MKTFVLFTMVLGNYFVSDKLEIHEKGYTPPSHFITKIPEQPTQTMTEINQITDFTAKFLANQLNINEKDLLVTDSYCQGDFCHVYYQRLVDGVTVQNQHAAVHMAKGKVINYSYSFTDSKVKECVPRLNQIDTVQFAEQELGLSKNQKEIQQVYYDMGKELILGYQFELQSNENHVQVVVNACKRDFVSIHSYFVS
jgi:Zn-dependent metalloprotease